MMPFNLKRIFLAISLLLIAFSSQGQWTGPKQKPTQRKSVKYGSLTPKHREDSAMKAFRAYGLGQFIHWGIYAIAGNQWEGVSARGGAAASEWIRSWSGPTAPENWTHIYDNLYKQFNPVDFDAHRWAKQAKDMGVRYMIFTTKHHDGFALWPTRYSDYHIGNTPYKKDIVGQVVDAYTQQGIDVYLYFSVMEWNNPDYMSQVPKTAEQKERFDRFLAYTRNQLLELLESYPQIKGFWFDGTWDPSWVEAYDFTYRLEKELREKHPGLIIGSRFRNDEYGKRHFDSNGELLGDYEQGWERKLPGDVSWLDGNDWDAVMTIPPNGWGYMKDWSGLYIKSTDDLLDMMMRAVSMNGNFVLNFGPDGEGRMHPGEDQIAEDFASWMKKNAGAVHGVGHADLPESKYGYYTQSMEDSTVLYLTVFNRPVNNLLRLSFAKTARLVPITAQLLENGRDLSLSHSEIGLDLDQHTYYDIQLPENFHASRAFVLKIQLGSPNQAKGTELMDAKM